jgi:tetratricopeptide (TPR) repeat protein
MLRICRLELTAPLIGLNCSGGMPKVGSGVEILRHLFSWQLSVMFLAAMTAGAQSAIPPGASEAQTAPSTISPGITVTGTTPGAEPTLPDLQPDQFTECYARSKTTGSDAMDFIAMEMCESQLAQDRRTVIEKCINRSGKNAPPVVIQACTELLDRKVFLGSDRFYVYANRAEAYLFQGDRQHALDDYNEAVKLAPHNAKLYYNRGVFNLAQPDVEGALRDFDTALSLDPKLVPALLQRAKIHKTQDDFSSALVDYSEAIRLEPKTAAIWSERGVVCLLQHDYAGAIKDEAQAIQLDPKLARAYFYRGAAFGGLGDSSKARGDIVTALRLDPSLQRYLTGKDQNQNSSPERRP